MKVFSDTLTQADLIACAREVEDDYPGVILRVSVQDVVDKCRVRRVRFDGVALRTSNELNHGRKPNAGRSGVEFSVHELSASFAEHGWWMARVFERDPHARIDGWTKYDGREDFHVATNGRFVPKGTPRERQAYRHLRRVS